LGQEFVLVTRRLNWGEDRVMYFNQNGKLRSMPASWTSVSDVNGFLEAAAGRSWFHVDDLLALVELLQTLKRERRARRRGVK
jgi:hypothetical protein